MPRKIRKTTKYKKTILKNRNERNNPSKEDTRKEEPSPEEPKKESKKDSKKQTLLPKGVSIVLDDSMTGSQHAIDQIAGNIANGTGVETKILDNLRAAIPQQAHKIDLLIQTVAAHQSERLAKYLKAANMMEHILFHPDVLARMETKDVLKLFELVQRHITQITDFVETKSSNPPIPEIIRQLLNLDTKKAAVVNESKKEAGSLDSTSREAIRNFLSIVRQESAQKGANAVKEEPTIVDAEVVEEEKKPKKAKTKRRKMKKRGR